MMFTTVQKSKSTNGTRTMALFACQSTIVYLIVFISLLFAGISDACTCMYQHPQAQACDSDFVIVASIQGRYQESKYLDSYKIRIRATYKATPEAQEVLMSGRIFTAKHDSLCGVNLEIGKLYLLTGRIDDSFDQVPGDICPTPLPKNLAVRDDEELTDDILEDYAHKVGCSCGITDRNRRKLLRSGRVPVNDSKGVCQIIQKGIRKYIRGSVETMAARVSLCNFHAEWKSVPIRQRKGFKRLYYHGCDCEIRPIYHENRPLPDGCSYTWTDQCATTHGICLPSSDDGACEWSHNQAQKQCHKAKMLPNI